MGQQFAVHRAIMVVDVERFGDPARTNLNQLAIRRAMYDAMTEAFAQSGIDWDNCLSEDRGDGALILIPSEVPKTRLVTGLPGLLAAAIFVIVFLNLSLFAFQLLPIPGLDGWDVVEAIFGGRNPRFFFNVNTRRQQIWIGAVVVIFLFQIFQGANLLAVVMTPFYYPASLISLGTCAGYGIQGFTGLHPCPQ